MSMNRLWRRLGIGKRDRFWLAIAFVVVAILFVIRLESREGFSDNGKPVWKSAVLGSALLRDSTTVKVLHASAIRSVH